MGNRESSEFLPEKYRRRGGKKAKFNIKLSLKKSNYTNFPRCEQKKLKKTKIFKKVGIFFLIRFLKGFRAFVKSEKVTILSQTNFSLRWS
jgi:hypothetical protein